MRGAHFRMDASVVSPSDKNDEDKLQDAISDLSDWLGISTYDGYLLELEEQGPFLFDRVREDL